MSQTLLFELLILGYTEGFQSGLEIIAINKSEIDIL